MHQPGIVLAAGDGEIAHRQSIGFESGQGFTLGNVHLIVGSRVEDREGIEFGDGALHQIGFRDIELGTFEGGYFVTA